MDVNSVRCLVNIAALTPFNIVFLPVQSLIAEIRSEDLTSNNKCSLLNVEHLIFPTLDEQQSGRDLKVL